MDSHQDRHPNLARQMRDVMAAVREPDARLPGRIPAEEWFFAKREREGKWLQVVVHYDGGEGWIVTAFVRISLPRA